MTPEHIQALKALTDLCEYFLAHSVTQALFVKQATTRFHVVEQMIGNCIGLLRIKDGSEKTAIIEELLTQSKQIAELDASGSLLDALARVESGQERMEANIAAMRAFLDSHD